MVYPGCPWVSQETKLGRSKSLRGFGILFCVGECQTHFQWNRKCHNWWRSKNLEGLGWRRRKANTECIQRGCRKESVSREYEMLSYPSESEQAEGFKGKGERTSAAVAAGWERENACRPTSEGQIWAESSRKEGSRRCQTGARRSGKGHVLCDHKATRQVSSVRKGTTSWTRSPICWGARTSVMTQRRQAIERLCRREGAGRIRRGS